MVCYKNSMSNACSNERFHETSYKNSWIRPFKKTSWRSEKWYVRVVGKKNKIVIMDLWKHQWCTLISFSQFIYLPDYSFQDAHQWFSENQSYIFFGSNEFSSRIDCKIKGTEGWKRKEAAEKKRNQGKEERRQGQL